MKERAVTQLREHSKIYRTFLSMMIMLLLVFSEIPVGMANTGSNRVTIGQFCVFTNESSTGSGLAQLPIQPEPNSLTFVVGASSQPITSTEGFNVELRKTDNIVLGTASKSGIAVVRSRANAATSIGILTISCQNSLSVQDIQSQVEENAQNYAMSFTIRTKQPDELILIITAGFTQVYNGYWTNQYPKVNGERPKGVLGTYVQLAGGVWSSIGADCYLAHTVGDYKIDANYSSTQGAIAMFVIELAMNILPVKVEAPSLPKNLSATFSNSSIILTWTASTQGTYPIAGYAIYRGTSQGNESPTPIATVDANTTSYTDTNVTVGITYYYYVKAFDNQNPPNYSQASNEARVKTQEISETTIFFDDFESYKAGTFPSTGGWALIWDGMGSQYQVITNAMYHSPSKSFQVWGAYGWSSVAERRFDSTARVIGFEASMMADGYPQYDIDGVGSVGFWNREKDTWGKYYVTVEFRSNKYLVVGFINDAGILDYKKIQLYVPGTWYKVKVILDRSTSTFSVWINDELKASGIKTKGTYDINALEVSSAWGGVRCYFDDVRVFTGEEAFTGTFEDDFSVDSGMWSFVENVINNETGVKYQGSAYRDSSAEYMVLTENRDHQGGVILFKKDIFLPFIVEFKYKAGGGTGADGLVFMFYKQREYVPSDGGDLGFVTSHGSRLPIAVPGYGIEFDNHYNGEYNDPSGNHIALIKDNVNNHLAYANDSRTEDNQWHNAKIVVGESSIEVYVDGGLVLTWKGTIDRTYGGLGFSAATGKQNNWHIIDDVRIITEGTPITHPSPPQNLSATFSNSSIILTWTASTQGTYPIAGYAIYRGTSQGNESPTPIATVGSNTTTYTDKDVISGITYYYYVKAFDKQNPPNYSQPSNEISAKIETFTITATADQGGTISPSGSVSVVSGSSQTFTITPNVGYKIKDVKVDGTSVGTVNTYTFTNVTSNHTIEAVFVKQSTQIVIVLKIGNTTFTVNGSTRTLDSPPLIKNGRTLLPIRPVVEALGGTVSWDGTEKKVTISLGSTTIELWIGKNTAKVNDASKPIDSNNPKVVPEIINGRTMLPLRFVTENLGCQLQWDPNTKTITITYQR